MFIRTLAAFTEALGVQNAPTIVYLSTIPWDSDDQRNEFIRKLTGYDIRNTNTYVP